MSDDWRRSAACDGMDSALWFPDDNQPATLAKAICATCPVREVCLEENLWEYHGIFGGTSNDERKRLRRGRKRPPVLVRCGGCPVVFLREGDHRIYCSSGCRHRSSRRRLAAAAA